MFENLFAYIDYCWQHIVSSYNEAPRLHNEKEPLYHGTCIFSSKSTMNIRIFTQPR